MKIKKDVSKLTVGCLVVMLAFIAFAVFRFLRGDIEIIFEANTWMMIGVACQIVTLTLGPRVGFESEDEEKRFTGGLSVPSFACREVM